MNNHQRAIKDYRRDTLEAILADYERKERKDRWDKDRIEAIRSELKRRSHIRR